MNVCIYQLYTHGIIEGYRYTTVMTQEPDVGRLSMCGSMCFCWSIYIHA